MRTNRFPRVLTLATAVLIAAAVPAEALVRSGPLSISGNLETQNLIRHPDVDEYDFIMQRNTLRLRVDLRLLEYGKGTLGDYRLPGLKTVDFYLLYRPVYDSIYDIRPGGHRKAFPYRGANDAGNFDQFTSDVRDAERTSNAGLNAFREVYVDLEFRSGTTIRAGRQQIVWGETDQFRMLDRVNPLDLTWHLSIEPFSEIRKPLWMIKVLHNIGSLGPMSDVFVEGYWGLGDWTPGERKFLPYPWSNPVANPFVNRATCSDPSNDLTCEDFEFLDGTTPFRMGDYDGRYNKDPIENGQWGTRLVFSTPQQVQIGLHYFYNRLTNDDSSQPTFLQAVDQQGPIPPALGGPTAIPTNNLLSIAGGTLPARAIYPYIHTVGVSANYFEPDVTQAVFKLETIYELDLPFSDNTKAQSILNPACAAVPPGPSCAVAPIVPSGFFGVTKSDMWKGMIGFDRPTWVPLISTRNTVNFIVQHFWHYMVDDPQNFRGALASSVPAGSDKVRRWETLTTAAATGFFGPGGKYVPLGLVGIDWANHYAMLVGWRLDYYLNPNFFLRVGQNFYFVPGYGGVVAQPWPLGGTLRNRDETSLGAVWQF